MSRVEMVHLSKLLGELGVSILFRMDAVKDALLILKIRQFLNDFATTNL